MLITGKIKDIQKNSPGRDIYTVVLEKTRKGKKILIPVTFWGRLSWDIQSGKIPGPVGYARPVGQPFLKIGMRVDIQAYIYGKPVISNGKQFWDTYIVAESWRPYKAGSKRYREIANKDTGEIIKRKAELPRGYDYGQA